MASPEPGCVQAIERLRRLGGPSLANKVIDLFLNTSRDRIEALREGQAQEDWELVEHVAHSLRSSAEHVGLCRLGELAGAIESQAREQRRQAVARLLCDVARAVDVARRDLGTARNLIRTSVTG